MTDDTYKQDALMFSDTPAFLPDDAKGVLFVRVPRDRYGMAQMEKLTTMFSGINRACPGVLVAVLFDDMDLTLMSRDELRDLFARAA